MLNFKRYNDIDNVGEGVINKISTHWLINAYPDLWAAHEKLHGANFSIWIDANEIKFAKRSGWIDSTDKFYGYEQAVNSIQDALMQLQKLTQDTSTMLMCIHDSMPTLTFETRIKLVPITSITIFGEL